MATQIRASKADKLIETKKSLDEAGVKLDELVAFKVQLDQI